MTDSPPPKRYRVDLLPHAARDVAGIFAFFVTIDPAHGAAVTGRLLDAADTLCVMPHRFRVYRENARPARQVRVMPGPSPYLIFYRVHEAAAVVELLSFRHAARRPPTRFPAR